MQVDCVETERLLLEPISLIHTSGMFALWSDPEVCRYSGPIRDYEGRPIPSPVSDPSESDRIIEFWVRACSAGWGLRWALCDRTVGTFLGTAGFNSLGECSEYAYHLRPEYWHRGLMSEASHAVWKWARGVGCTHVEAFIEPDNMNSVRFAERHGFHTNGETTVDNCLRFVKHLG